MLKLGLVSAAAIAVLVGGAGNADARYLDNAVTAAPTVVPAKRILRMVQLQSGVVVISNGLVMQNTTGNDDVGNCKRSDNSNGKVDCAIALPSVGQKSNFLPIFGGLLFAGATGAGVANSVSGGPSSP